MTLKPLALALPVLLVVAGCSKSEPTGGAAPAATGAAATGAAVAAKPAGGADDSAKQFKNRCSTCHGEAGKGDGPGGAALNPKPRNFADAAWQAKVTDEHLEKVIVEGGAAVGLNAAMPGAPDLKEKPEVVKGLVKMIRGFKG
ncbi:MAG: c-type cytochrome [Polyangiaceae bacterium]|nr:c-type cytochrome [Polyangiaceae bacterium]